jgi:hypothetical protein
LPNPVFRITRVLGNPAFLVNQISRNSALHVS